MGAITVCVCTYGGQEWVDLAYQRAIPSVPNAVPVRHVHGETLAEARNEALEQVRTELVIFLDADDQLEKNYCGAMAVGTADIRVPLVRYGAEGAAQFPRVVGHEHLCSPECLEEGNWIVIGAAARTELLREVGGFRDYPIWEDWDLWLRCYRTGARIGLAPGAVYRADEAPGRNDGLTMAQRRRIFTEIAK